MVLTQCLIVGEVCCSIVLCLIPEFAQVGTDLKAQYVEMSL